MKTFILYKHSATVKKSRQKNRKHCKRQS